MTQRRYLYRAWIRIRGGVDRYGSELFRTRREALLDAARIIDEVRADPAIQWRNEIETYGSVQDDRPEDQALQTEKEKP